MRRGSYSQGGSNSDSPIDPVCSTTASASVVKLTSAVALFSGTFSQPSSQRETRLAQKPFEVRLRLDEPERGGGLSFVGDLLTATGRHRLCICQILPDEEYRKAVVMKLNSATRLRVSEDCCLYYLAQNSTRMPVAEIAAAVGISDRTFYRYFPVKAESVSPVFDSMTATTNSIAAAGASPTLRLLMVDAFAAMFTSRVTSRASEFFPLVFADPEMWALFLRKVHDGETTLAPILAVSLGLPSDHNRARVAAAAVASSTRIALERLSTHGADPASEFAGLLDAFLDPGLFAPAISDGVSLTTSADGPTG